MTIGVEKLVELERKDGEIVPKGKAKNSKGKAVFFCCCCCCR